MTRGARAMWKKCAFSYVIVCSSVVRRAALRHCIAFNVFYVLFWFTLHSGAHHKLGYFTTSIIGHNVYVIFSLLCEIIVGSLYVTPKKFIHLLINFHNLFIYLFKTHAKKENGVF
jgi:hypothetical protein